MGYTQFFNGIIYTIGWLFCVISGANQITLWPPLVTGVIVFLQLAYFKFDYLDLMTLLYSVFIGLLMEILILNTGIVEYATQNHLFSSLPPGWIWSLYFLFSMTFNHALKFLKTYRWLPFVFGLIGGPVSYLLGKNLGAVTFLSKNALLWLGGFWGIYLFVIYRIIDTLERTINHFLDSSKPLILFYDSVCPICSKEINHLKKRKETGNVQFVDLAPKQEFEKSFPQINYLDAMKEIHAIGPDGKVLKGIDAFAETYARRDLVFLSLLLKAPLLNHLFSLSYKLWAKYRLKNRCKIQPLDE